jgi:hypothetical protein
MLNKQIMKRVGNCEVLLIYITVCCHQFS